MKKNAREQENSDFAQWLRRTARELRHGELPPESWERRHSPFMDSATQRRIAALIAEIAERGERPARRRPRKR